MFRAYAAGFSAIAMWSLMPVLAKFALGHISGSYFLVIRFAIAAAVSSMIWPRGLGALRRLPGRDGLKLALTLTLNFALSTYALQHMPATWFVLIFSLSPIVSLYALGLKINVRARFGVGLAALGTVGFVATPSEPVPLSILPFAALFTAMLTWTYYSKQLKRLQGRFADGELSAMTNVIVLPPVVILWLLDGTPSAGFAGTAAYAMVAMGVLVPFAYAAFSVALRGAPVFGVTCQYLEPVFGFALAAVLLGESINRLQVAGSCLILAGLALTTPAADA